MKLLPIFHPWRRRVRCHAIGEPAWQFPVPGISLQLLAGHTLEKLSQGELFAVVNPLPVRIDLGIRLDGSDYSRSCHLDVTGPFDNSLKGGAHIPLPLGKEAESVGVTVNACSVSQTILFGQRRRAAPGNKLRFNVCPLRVDTDGTIPPVAPRLTGLILRVGISLCLQFEHCTTS